MCTVVVSKQSCKHGNHPIRGVNTWVFFFTKNHDFSRFFINFARLLCWNVGGRPEALTHIHSHRELNPLSLSTESTCLLVCTLRWWLITTWDYETCKSLIFRIYFLVTPTLMHKYSLLLLLYLCIMNNLEDINRRKPRWVSLSWLDFTQCVSLSWFYVVRWVSLSWIDVTPVLPVPVSRERTVIFDIVEYILVQWNEQCRMKAGHAGYAGRCFISLFLFLEDVPGRTVIFDIVEYIAMEWTMPNESRTCRICTRLFKRRRVFLTSLPLSSIGQKRIVGLKVNREDYGVDNCLKLDGWDYDLYPPD